jgi:23S rRNA (guanine745-N1)-methyltransferase
MAGDLGFATARPGATIAAMAIPPLTPLAAAALHVGTPERVLEIECGEGEGTLFLAREFPRARVRGVDRSEQAIRRASARVGLDPEGRVAFKVGAPGSLPFPEDLFDLAAIVDAPPPVGEIARILRPGGYLILASTHDSETLRGRGARLRRRRLSRARIELEQAAAAGEGGFSVWRLRGGRAGAPSD